MRHVLIPTAFALVPAIGLACSTFDAATGEPTGAEAGAPEVDAGAAGDAAADGAFCDLQNDAAFCDDFDHPGPIDVKWNGLENIGATPTAAIDSTRFVSPPNSALFVAERRSGSSTIGSRLYRTNFANVPIACDLDWMPIALSGVSGDTGSIAALTLYPVRDGGTSSSARVELYVEVKNDGGVYFYVNDTADAGIDGTSGQFMGLLAKPPVPWLHIRIETTATQYQLTVGGQTSGLRSHNLSLPIVTSLFLGAFHYAAADGSDGWTFAFDNVVCR